ncbi:hypothetical protein ESCO_001507 [Escovopsis weberi]|uniref:Uncharacterized protein n=1 Tax=Escovopsis weberi TaxID=150374 RepID=A0A0M8MYA7_ESCWE|nr:hypothetical protein ESCO_001507 [Escovopsis weberi]
MSSWVGAPPVSEGGFSFSNGVFFAEASGKNQHRRASPPELAAHFSSGNERDHPAHWFEAQLAHYGLRPSKTKSVARMRLFDAVQANSLAVPSHIALLEDRLKREWTRQDRAAKRTDPPAPNASPSKSKSKSKQPAAPVHGTKRKAADQPVVVNVTVSNTAIAGAPPKYRVKQTARRGTPWQRGPTRAESALALSPVPPPAPAPTRPKQTARCSRGGAYTTPGRTTQGPILALPPSPSPPPPPATTRTKQTARCSRGRGGGSAGRGRSAQGRGFYDPPSPSTIKPEYDDDGMAYGQLPPLGWINGQYDIQSRYVDEQWPSYNSDFSLVLKLAGTAIWGSFDLGVISGILHIEQRPRQASHDAVPFTWRGREDEGPILFGHNRGWIRFLGGGRVDGEFDFQGISFEGMRDAEFETMSGVSARELQDEWNEYTEERFEEENRARWR